MTTRKRGTGYQADFMVAGTRYREPFGTESEARAWELQTRAAIIEGKPIPPVSNGRSDTGAGLHTLGALFEYTKAQHWLHNPKIKAPDTAIRRGKQCVDFFGSNTAVSAITTDEMKRMQRSMIGDGLSYPTTDRRLASLSKMLRFAVEKGVIPRMPAIPMSGITNENERYLAQEEVHKLLAWWRELEEHEAHAFTVFALDCGARSTALKTAQWKHFNADFTTCHFPGGDKRSLPRTIQLSKGAVAAVLYMRGKYASQAGPFTHLVDNWAFRGLWDRMQAHFDWPDVVVHTLRHTCGTWLYFATRDLKLVQYHLGHRTLSQSAVYAKLVPIAMQGSAAVFDKLFEAPPKLTIVTNPVTNVAEPVTNQRYAPGTYRT